MSEDLQEYEIREQVAALFESSLENAGLYWSKSEKQPKYWRGRVDSQGVLDDIFCLYDITDSPELYAADNKTFIRQIFINGSIYTRQGFSNGEFQDICKSIQKMSKENGFIFKYQGEGVDMSIDQDSPIYYINFEAEKRISA